MHSVCTAAGTPPTRPAALLGLREHDHDFAVRWMDAVADGVDALTDELRTAALSRRGEPASVALCFLLARRVPHEYGHVVDVDVRPEATPTVEAFLDAYAAFALELRALVERGI